MAKDVAQSAPLPGIEDDMWSAICVGGMVLRKNKIKFVLDTYHVR